MISGKDFKRLVNCIPDDAGVTINGNWNVDVVGVRVESGINGWLADLQLTPGFSVTKDSVLEEMFKPFKDAQTR